MPIFPIVDNEALIQENDKTRIDGAASFVSGTTPITKIEISPNRGVALIDVTTEKFLDWVYGFEIDVDLDNNLIHFTEGGPDLVATLTDGTYTLAALVAEIQTQLNAEGALTYTVSLSDLNAITIEANGLVTFDPDQDSSILPSIGLSAPGSGSPFVGSAIEQIEREISIKVTNAGGDMTKTANILVISEIADRLFSSDDQLRKHEGDVLKYIIEGRASFKDVHRRAQTLILAWLHKEGFINSTGDPVVASQLRHKEDVREWSAMMSLRLIFEGVSNAIDDVYAKKAEKYQKLENFYRDRAYVRVSDLNSSESSTGSSLNFDRVDIRSCRVLRR